MRVTQNGWFAVENPIKMDDLGISPHLGKPLYPADMLLLGKTSGDTIYKVTNQ